MNNLHNMSNPQLNMKLAHQAWKLQACTISSLCLFWSENKLILNLPTFIGYDSIQERTKALTVHRLLLLLKEEQ